MAKTQKTGRQTFEFTVPCRLAFDVGNLKANASPRKGTLVTGDPDGDMPNEKALARFVKLGTVKPHKAKAKQRPSTSGSPTSDPPADKPTE